MSRGGKEVCIDIDFGSTDVRAFAWLARGIGKCFPNPNAFHIGLDGMSYPAYGYLYDDNGSIYLPQTLYVNREPESLKYWFYLLSGDPHKLMEQYPLMKKLRNAYNVKLRGKLETGIVAVLRNLRTVIERNEAFVAHGWRIGRLCVTVPNQWTLEFEEVYTTPLAAAFSWTLEETKRRTLFYTESDALGWFLLSSDDYVKVATLLRGREEQRVVLILDFGGHNSVRHIHCCLIRTVSLVDNTDVDIPSQNGAIFWVQNPQNQQPQFFRHGPGFCKSHSSITVLTSQSKRDTNHAIGKGSGGQHLYYNVLRACEEKFRSKTGTALTPAVTEQIRQKFIMDCRYYWGPSNHLPDEYVFHLFNDNY